MIIFLVDTDGIGAGLCLCVSAYYYSLQVNGKKGCFRSRVIMMLYKSAFVILGNF